MAAPIGAPPAGSYIQGGQVFLTNGQPYLSGGSPVYLNNGQYSSSAPGAVTPTPSGSSTPGNVSLYLNNPYTPPAITQTQATMPTGPGGAAIPPEVAALQQLRQINPGALKLSHWLNQGYLGGTSGNAKIGSNLSKSYLQQLQQAESGQLPAGVMREIQQSVAGNQVASGNAAGVAQAAQQAMTTGTAGLNYLYQSQGNAANYASQIAQQAQGYLQSGTTPYQQSMNYVNTALGRQSAALSGGSPPTYGPGAPGVAGTQPWSYLNPNAGSQFASGTQGFLNAGVGAKPGSPDTSSALIGSGIAAAGSLAASTASYWGPALAAGLAAICWVSREVYGLENPKWLQFRKWMLTKAPDWLRELYVRKGERFAAKIRNKPRIKESVRAWMDQILELEAAA
jgi:hypothetical protein